MYTVYLNISVMKFENESLHTKPSLKVCCLTKMTFNKFNLQNSRYLLNVIQTAYLTSLKVKTLQKQE